jgi:hypothetical protein
MCWPRQRTLPRAPFPDRVAAAPHPLASASLIHGQVRAGSVWHHLFLDRFPDPLGLGHSPSRFSDPRRAPRTRFGVYYIGQTFEVAFLETIVRDRKNGNPGTLVLGANDLIAYAHVAITVRAALDVVDLRGGSAIAMGLPTNALRAQSHRQGQKVSLALYRHADSPDGIWYPSRLNGDENIALYDRAVSKLSAGPRRSLGSCPELAPILDRYRIAIV